MKRKKKITPAKKALARWKIIKEKKGKNYFLHYARSYIDRRRVCVTRAGKVTGSFAEYHFVVSLLLSRC